MYSVGLVLGLLVMSGLIAIIGDRVGRTVGRRRLSLFGLRPRHTSAIITVITGILIAAGSLAAMVTVSGEVRLALLRIDEIQRTLARYREELRQAQQARDQALALRDRAENQRRQAEAERAQADALRQRAEQELKEARQQLASVQRELQQARGQLRQAEKRLEQARSELAYQSARAAQLQQLSETLAGRVEELRRQVASLENTQRQLSEAIIVLWNTAQRLQYGSVAYQKDEIVLAAVIDARESRDRAQQELLAFLRRADAAAYARARPGGGEAYSEGVLRIRPEEFDDAVELLASGRGPWVVRVRAERNTLVGETVPVKLELVPRGLAYRRGQVVAEQVVDARRVAAEDQVLELLRTANEMAIRYGGMVSGPDGTVGKLVSADEFARAVREVRQAGGPVKVVAVAAADTYNTDGPLQIRLQVQRVEGS
ncbi:MAG TPA: DUF3084 domain-containing protein [Limnochordales bacterium]